MALEQQEQGGNEHWREDTREHRKTSRERYRVMVDFSMAGVVHEAVAHADPFPKRQACKRENKSANNREEINIEREHGALRMLHQLNELNKLNQPEGLAACSNR